jgi:ubiquitin-conjugating enzyme E2 O
VQWFANSDDEHWEYFDDFEDSNEEVQLKDGQVEVLWNNNQRISQVHHTKLTLVDRGLVHGDVVASISDPFGQTGVVIDVVLSVDLMLVKYGQRIPNVFCKYLTDIHPFMLGRHVTLKNPPKRVGTIDDVIYDVEVQFPDNSKCILRNATPEILKIIEDDVSEDEDVPIRNYLYYPSQVVSATAEVWAGADWLTKPRKKDNKQQQKKKKQRIRGKVTKVTPVTIVVSWIKQPEDNLPEQCKPDDLIVLSHLKHTKLEVGDYTIIHPTIKSYFMDLAKGLPAPEKPKGPAKPVPKGGPKKKASSQR